MGGASQRGREDRCSETVHFPSRCCFSCGTKSPHVQRGVGGAWEGRRGPRRGRHCALLSQAQGRLRPSGAEARSGTSRKPRLATQGGVSQRGPITRLPHPARRGALMMRMCPLGCGAMEGQNCQRSRV